MNALLNKRPIGVSVVIPTLDRMDFVLRALESVRCTSTERVEIIVIDDGSAVDLRPQLPPSNAAGIAVRAFRFERNRGPQAARNLGIRRAAFSHIAFLDSDDSFSAEKLDRVLSELDRQGLDLLFHGVLGMPIYASLARAWLRISGLLPFHWWLALLNPIPTPALVIRRECRLGVTKFRHCEDWAFLLHFVQPGCRVLYLDQELCSVHRQPGSQGGLSGAVWRMRIGEFRARRVLLRHRRQLGVSVLARLALGSLAGGLRVLNDALRGRFL